MRKNKLLALILTLCMLFTTIGSITVANAADAVTVINVGQGVTYKLPETINSVAVTAWTNAAGAAVTTVDTSLVGYRYYTATLADETTVKYRVNVGEYEEIMRDTFEDYSKDQYYGEINATVDGATFYKEAYTEETATDGSTTRLMKVDGKTVLVFGPNSSNWDDVKWTPGKGDAEKGDAFRLSANVKVVDFDPSTSKSTTNYFVELRPYNVGGAQFRAKTDASEQITGTEIRSSGATDTSNVATVNVEWEASQSDETTTYSMSDYVTLSIAGNNVQYSTFLEDAEVDNSRLYTGNSVANNGINRINISKTSKVAETNATVYVDEVVYEKAIYVTDTLSDVTVPTVTLAKGDAAAQTATVSLNMSDDTTEDFTVKFNADTTTPGTGYTAQGTIDGFDDTVTVTYTVLNKTSEVINTFVGADALYANGTAVDTSLIGRKYKTISDENGITEYTVNVGGWDVEYADDMSQHTNTTVDHDKVETTDELPIVASEDEGGFYLTASSNTRSTGFAVVTEYEGDAVLKFADKNNAGHIKWTLTDSIDGSFKYSMRTKIVADSWVNDARQEALQIDIYNTDGDVYFRGKLYTPKTSDNTNYMMFAPYRSNQQANTEPTTVGAIQRESDGKWETDWFTIEVIGKADTGTHDIYVNGVLTHRDFVKWNGDTTDAEGAVKVTDCTFGNVQIYKSTEKVVETYVDDVSISSYYKFEGDLPSGQEMLVGKDTAAEGSIALTFSNGDVKNIPVTMPQLQTDKLGTYETNAVLAGFDDTTTVTVKVCNYDISALGFTANGGSVSAPVAGGAVADATFTNAGNYTQAKAIFAWYNAQGKLEVSKIADLAGITKGETKKVSVNMQLPDDITGGVLKVFVVDSISNLMPLDISALYDSFTQA